MRHTEHKERDIDSIALSNLDRFRMTINQLSRDSCLVEERLFSYTFHKVGSPGNGRVTAKRYCGSNFGSLASTIHVYPWEASLGACTRDGNT